MTTERIREIQKETAYPDSISVQQALCKVWNECVEHYESQLKEKDIEITTSRNTNNSIGNLNMYLERRIKELEFQLKEEGKLLLKARDAMYELTDWGSGSDPKINLIIEIEKILKPK
jgi:translation initiation factor 2B subunit (eIF-2B alpha/beta/delta family)